MTPNSQAYKVECPHCGHLEVFKDDQSNLWGVWGCPDCNGEFTPQAQPLTAYDQLWYSWGKYGNDSE